MQEKLKRIEVKIVSNKNKTLSLVFLDNNILENPDV